MPSNILTQDFCIRIVCNCLSTPYWREKQPLTAKDYFCCIKHTRRVLHDCGAIYTQPTSVFSSHAHTSPIDSNGSHSHVAGSRIGLMSLEPWHPFLTVTVSEMHPPLEEEFWLSLVFLFHHLILASKCKIETGGSTGRIGFCT